MTAFFDTALIEQEGSAFLREDKLEESLRHLIPRAHITKGHYSHPATAELRDLVWNHMDQTHRPYIHRTYGDAVRMHIGRDSAFSLTRFGKWVVIPVFDGYHKKNGFYQVLCLFGLIVIVNIIECNASEQGTRMDIDWAIASHRFLRFLHKPLDRRLRRLNEVQNDEDEVMRDQRVALRKTGYRFQTDEPDFLKANVAANNVIFPPLETTQTISIADLREGEVRRVGLGDRAYLVRRSGQGIEIWPGICPHEGAPLEIGDLSGSTVKCPWHGLEYGRRVLDRTGMSLTLCGARVILGADALHFDSTEQASGSAEQGPGRAQGRIA